VGRGWGAGVGVRIVRCWGWVVRKGRVKSGVEMDDEVRYMLSWWRYWARDMVGIVGLSGQHLGEDGF